MMSKEKGQKLVRIPRYGVQLIATDGGIVIEEDWIAGDILLYIDKKDISKFIKAIQGLNKHYD